ncbi:MAG: flagellar export chaperone FliS [Opitutaceae bacterium]|nr:flagellar export chaperone FliS [Verrucomicrobiales bacterium]
MRIENPWQSYRKIATQTASSGQLVQMLFEGAIRFLQCSLKGFSLDDPAESNQTVSNNVIRAQAIIQELNQSLNMEAGGEFASTMRRLYDYLDWRLQQSNMRKDPAGIEEAISRLAVLHGAWTEMLQSGGAMAPVPQLELAVAS